MAYLIYLCAFFGISASAFSDFLVQPRILMKFAQDGLFFEIFKEVDPLTLIPIKGSWITGAVICLICFFLDLEPIAKVLCLGSLVPYSDNVDKFLWSFLAFSFLLVTSVNSGWNYIITLILLLIVILQIFVL